MYTVSIFYTDQHRLLSIAALVDVLQTVNRFAEDENNPPVFNIQFITPHDNSEIPSHYSIFKRYTISEETLPTSDMIFIPAFSTRALGDAIRSNQAFIPYLVSQYKQGAIVSSLCTGTFLLAASGLLDGLPATTHVEAADAFSMYFPKVLLQRDAVVTVKDNIFTSGGATSSFHLKLKIIENYCNKAMAIRVAKNFAIDLDRHNQLYFDQFSPVEIQDDDVVSSVQKNIKTRFSELRSVEDAISTVPASRRNIIRRFKNATGITPIQYLQKTKIEAAKQLLENSNNDIFDIMHSIGYSDIKNFRHLFKKYTGLTPTAYRGKYNLAKHNIS